MAVYVTTEDGNRMKAVEAFWRQQPLKAP
jgi:hypothetical protein